MVVSGDGHLHRKLADVGLEHRVQGEVELLSSAEESLWCKQVLVANGFGRRSPAPSNTVPHGARWTRCGEASHGGRQQLVGRDGRRATCLRGGAAVWTRACVGRCQEVETRGRQCRLPGVRRKSRACRRRWCTGGWERTAWRLSLHHVNTRPCPPPGPSPPE
jgi:hypothetical protein